MEKIGYVLSEIPVLFFVIWFAIRLVQVRRHRDNRPIVTHGDLQLLHSRPGIRRNSLEFYIRFALAVLAVVATGLVEIALLAPFGAAIVACSFLLTSTAIVRHFLVIAP
jgi:hypothetical protein